MSFKSLTIAALGLVLMGGAQKASALITIDDFSTGTISNFINGSSGVGATADSGQVASTNTIGGYRDAKITLDATNGAPFALIQTSNPPTGVFSFSASSGNRGTLNILYNANGAGLGGVDLTEAGSATGITIDFVSADAGASTTIDVYDGTNTASRTLPSAGVGALFFAFTDFTNPSALSSAVSVKLTIVGTIDGDYQIDQLSTRTPGVPEPVTAGLSLIGMSVLGLAAARRRHA